MALYEVEKDSSGAVTGTKLVAGGTLYASAPIGTIFATMAESAPSGFLMCDGTAYSATDYPELWAILPSTVKNTTNNTFTIDLRETTLKGAGLTGNTVGAHLDSDGLAVGEFLDDRLQQITLNVTNGNGGQGDRLSMGGGTILNTPLASTSTGFRYGVTTEVKSVGVNYIIKAKMVALPADLQSQVEEISNGKADRTTKVTAADLGFEVNSTQSVKNTLNALGNYNVIQFRWGSATSFNISDGTNSLPSSGASILRASGEDSKKEAILIDADKNVYLIGFKNTSEYIKKLVTESDLTTTQITGIVKAEGNFTINAYKSGKVVTVVFNANRSGTWTLNQQLATSGLPIPAGNGYQGLIMTTNGDAVGLSVTGEGALIVGYPSTREGWLFGSITYVCQ